MRITIEPLPEEFEQEDSFEEFIDLQFPVGTKVRVSADGVVWDGTVTKIEQPTEYCLIEHGDWTGKHVRISSCPPSGGIAQAHNL